MNDMEKSKIRQYEQVERVGKEKIPNIVKESNTWERNREDVTEVKK